MPVPHLLAVLAAAAATMILGGLWYSPLLLGRQWIRAHGYSADQVAQMRANANRAYLASFLCYLLMAIVFGVLLGTVGATGALPGLHWGALAWLGFALPLGLTAHLFSNKPLSALLIDSGYQLAYLILMGVILALWR
jgi:uncharacterized protein DUF1761